MFLWYGLRLPLETVRETVLAQTISAYFELRGITRVTDGPTKALNLVQCRSSVPVAVWWQDISPEVGDMPNWVITETVAIHNAPNPHGTTHIFAAPAGNHDFAALQVCYDN